MYFKIFKPISWDERPAERRSRLIQRFLKIATAASQPRNDKIDRFGEKDQRPKSPGGTLRLFAASRRDFFRFRPMARSHTRIRT